MHESIRRYDIDALRVIAIGLLLVYHVAIGFQSWGIMVGFISLTPPLESIWPPMSALNIWRIPLLFFVSGMGVSFAFGKRSMGQLLMERSRRILLPFVFGILCIVPLHMLVLKGYYGWDLTYAPGPGHLWFLGNIFVYTLLLLPLFWILNRYAESRAAIALRSVIASPLGWLIAAAAFVGEAVLFKPYPYEMYAMNGHGFALGLLAFLFGYLFVYSGNSFWSRLSRWRWLFAALAIGLFAYRTIKALPQPPLYLLSLESNAWVFAVLAFGHKHLNRPSRALRYLSEAAYPIYIVHMVFLYLASALVFPLTLNPYVKLGLVLLLTFGGCFASYEFIIRRLRWIRPLFGLKPDRAELKKSPEHGQANAPVSAPD